MKGTAAANPWRQLLSRAHRGVTVVLAGGVALYATNVYLTTSLLPSATLDIGGREFYSWSTTVFLLTSVMTSVLVSRLLRVVGSRAGYLGALTAFIVGTLVCTLAPTMPVLLAGRAVQGAGGGLLAGLAYALIRVTLPPPLWSRGTALISAMWGVGTFAGPALGGAFAAAGLWRGAFAVLAVGAGLMCVVVPRVLTSRRSTVAAEPFPALSLILLGAAALVVSGASVLATPVAGLTGILLSLVLVVGFLVHERRTTARILPARAFTPESPLRWIYATLAVLAIGSTTETFVPLFGQQLAGLGPLAAGFLGAAIAAGWTLGEIPSAGSSRPAATRRLIIAGPAVLTIGLAATALTQRAQASGLDVSAWAVALLLVGAGIGIAWPHLATDAMSSSPDPGDRNDDGDGDEGDKASATINTVQLLANAFGASLTGVAVNLGQPDTVRSAQYLFAGFAVLSVIGVVTAALSRRPTTRGVRTTSSGDRGTVDGSGT